MPRSTNKQLLQGDLHKLAEVCARLLGASRQALGVFDTDNELIEANAVLSEGEERKDDEEQDETAFVAIPCEGRDFLLGEASILPSANMTRG